MSITTVAMVANLGLVLRCAYICHFILLLSSRHNNTFIVAYLVVSSLILMLYVVYRPGYYTPCSAYGSLMV
jgi:hypothetical membrane protein